MSWRRAPVQLAAQDLACWLELSLDPDSALVAQLRAESRELLLTLATALALPEGRAADLARADRALTRLRALTEVARASARLSPRQARHVYRLAEPVGNMLGGWRRSRRRHAGRARRAIQRTGSGP